MLISLSQPLKTRSSSAVESLEPRRLLSGTTLRIASYNVEADIDGYTSPRPGIATVLEAIGAHSLAGVSKPIDVLGLEETTSNTATVAPIVADMNAYYGAGTYAASPLQLSESGGDTADGNGPNALIYDTKTVTLLQSYAVTGSLGSSTGVYRQIGRYELQPVGGTAASDFYIYVEHYKSGTGATNARYRGEEAAVVRADEATLPAGSRVIYMGDFNTNTDGEAIFENLMASGQGQAFDEFDQTGGVGNVSQALDTLSEQDTSLTYRDDYQMVTQNVLSDSTGLELANGSEETFGNNGSVAAGGSVDSSGNTALADLSNSSAVLSALTTASDHLPIVADYTDVLTTTAATGSVSGTVTGGKAGETIYLDANNNSKLDTGELATTTTTTTTTTSTGTFTFSSVPAGAYVVRQVLPSGYTQTSPAGNYGDHVTVTAGSKITGQTFTDKSTAGGNVSGTVTGGKAGETIYLDANNNSVLDSGELSTTTTSTGTYSFSNVPIGAYVARQVLPIGYTQTTPGDNYGDHVTVTAGSTSTGNNFADTASHTKLTGATIGTAGSYNNSGNTIAKATDGNLSTFFDGQASNGNWVGLNLGSSKTIDQVAFAPRASYESRMNGGVFQISTTADFSSGFTTIYTITGTPAAGLTTVTLSSPVTARYIRYLSPNSSHGDISEFQVFS